jgi:hypothetical protein
MNDNELIDQVFAVATAKKIIELENYLNQLYASYYRERGDDAEVVQ